MKFIPKHYQERGRDFILAHKRCALHMDVGTGKTATTILACMRLLESFGIRGVMVFAPLRVATIAWPEEFRKWDEFHKIKFTVVRGAENERKQQLSAAADFYVLNYDLLPWWVAWVADNVRKAPIRTDMLVFDESSRLKSGDSSRFRSIKPLADSALYPRIVELTGTPSPEDYEDLWSQYRLLDRGQRLEPYITHFRNRYFNINPFCRFDRKLKRGADVDIQSHISDITYTARAEDHLELPALLENVIHVNLPATARKHYRDVEKEMVTRLEDETVAATSAAIVSEKCRQVASGAIYSESGEAIPLHEEKFDALDEMVESKPGNVLVAYWYKHELDTIRRRYPSAPVLGPRMSEIAALRTVREWNTGKIPLLFMHPASVGHGINLQEGGHHLVWLTIPWSNEIYRQTVGRLYRMGQKQRVTVHRILALGTVDMLVDKALRDKEFSQQGLRMALAQYTNKDT